MTVTVALAAQRGLLGLIVGVGAVALLKPLLWLAQLSAFAALLTALLLGLLLGASVRPLPRFARRQPPWAHLLGALGGVLLGGALTLALAASLPVGRDLNGAVRYPAPGLPLEETLQGSRLVEVGRAILLYPLLEREGLVAPEERAALRILHGLLVPDRPWEGGRG